MTTGFSRGCKNINCIAEERDANNVVTRRFYPQGEQISRVSYYYTRDHLGSVRELTDSAGAVRARYDYDPYGNRTKLSGDLDAQFGFTGHYYHQPSGLNLTLYRAYDWLTGRWLSRDPIEEEGGSNLYKYALNDPIRLIDPLGLDSLSFNGNTLFWLNDNGNVMRAWPAASGPFGKGPLPNGRYNCDHYRNRGPSSNDSNPAMTRDDVGFSYDLNPAFPTNRTLLRIHPDGGPPGTHGCIGIRANGGQTARLPNSHERIPK